VKLNRIHAQEMSKLKNEIIKRDDEIRQINGNYEKKISSLKSQIISGKIQNKIN
jgi:hypothetical protein